MIHPPTKTQTHTYMAGLSVPGVSILTHFIHHAVVAGVMGAHTYNTHMHAHTQP